MRITPQRAGFHQPLDVPITIPPPEELGDMGM
jgi:hypothetical protein